MQCEGKRIRRESDVEGRKKGTDGRQSEGGKAEMSDERRKVYRGKREGKGR